MMTATEKTFADVNNDPAMGKHAWASCPHCNEDFKVELDYMRENTEEILTCPYCRKSHTCTPDDLQVG